MNGNKMIWILEDDRDSQFVYQEILAPHYDLSFFETLRSFVETATSDTQGPDLLIADIKLPDQNFVTFLSSDQSKTIRFPFIVISSMDELATVRTCFHEGALDYLTKPFSKNELLAKVERYLRKEEILPSTKNLVHEVSTDPLSLRVTRRDDFAQLTTKEMQIFSLIRNAAGEAMPRDQIRSEVWSGTNVTTKTLDVHLFNLRRKVAKLAIEITFVSPDGFALVVKPLKQNGHR